MAPIVQKRLRGAKKAEQAGTSLSATLVPDQSIPATRVAAYCRVSTDHDIQKVSLDVQIKTFTQKIIEHPGWKLVDIYVDEGITGTSVRRRGAFKRMVDDSKDGKIDYIITKSVSRFARNTVECLNYVRELKAVGVFVLFEKENIDTKSDVSEMVLTVLAAFAQEESRSISEHVKWGVRKRYESGIARWNMLYGYRHGPDDTYVIQEDEAVIVRRVYQMYLDGYSFRDIWHQLNEEGIPSPGNSTWDSSAVSNMLSNERYAGNIVLQKYLIENHLTGHRILNDETKVPSYFVQGHHAAIISEADFLKVQEIKAMRTQLPGQTSQYPFAYTEVRCPFCSARLVLRKTALQNNAYAWGCFADNGCGRFAIREAKFYSLVAEGYRTRWDKDPPGKRDNDPYYGVNYGWLPDVVEYINPSENMITIGWKDGSETTVDVTYLPHESRPAKLAEQYKKFLTYCPDGKYSPILMRAKEKKQEEENT